MYGGQNEGVLEIAEVSQFTDDIELENYKLLPSLLLFSYASICSKQFFRSLLDNHLYLLE